MSTENFKLERVLVRKVDTSTGLSQVEMPSSLGSGGLVDVSNVGLTQLVPGTWDMPTVNTSVFVASDAHSRAFYVGSPNAYSLALAASAGAVTAASVGLAAHVAAADPHPQYYNQARLIATPWLGRRNGFINGDFQVAQRGNGPFTTSGGPNVADMWWALANGSTHSTSRLAFGLGTTSFGSYEPQWYAQMVVTSVAGAGNYSVFEAHVEGVRTFAGQTVTLSFWAACSVAASNLGVEFHQFFGTGGSPSAEVTGIGAQQVSILSTTFGTRYSVTVTLPSISGKTLGTANDDSLRVSLWLDAGATFSARSSAIGQQSRTWSFWGMQLEPGSVATPFEVRPYRDVLADCQRYLNIYGNWSATGNDFIGVGLAEAATNAKIVIPFPCSMRAAPTFTAINATSHCVETVVAGANTNVAATAVAASGSMTEKTGVINVTTAGGLVNGSAALYRMLNDAAARAIFSAEI